jgi:hypothetical protein
MESSEYRRWPRPDRSVTLRVQIANLPELSEQVTGSVKISTGGVLFASALPLEARMPVDLFLDIPKEIQARTSRERHCARHVVRARPYSLPFGKSGIGIQFDACEVTNLETLLGVRYPELAAGNDLGGSRWFD